MRPGPGSSELEMTSALDVILTSCQKRHPRTPSSCCICTQRAIVRVSNSYALPKTKTKSNPVSPHLNGRHDHGTTTTTTTHWRINGKKKRKYTENRLNNNSSDQLYMQRTNKHKRCWKRKVGARVQKKKILGLPGDDDTEMFFTILLTCRCGGIHTWGSICMFRYRRPTWWLMSFENWTKKQARHWSRERVDTGRERVEREREKRKRRDPRGRRETEGQTEGERAREQKGTVTCDGVLAEERRRALYCGGPIFPPPAPPQPTLMLGFWKITT